jgi:hypothetical protein
MPSVKRKIKTSKTSSMKSFLNYKSTRGLWAKCYKCLNV